MQSLLSLVQTLNPKLLAIIRVVRRPAIGHSFSAWPQVLCLASKARNVEIVRFLYSCYIGDNWASTHMWKFSVTSARELLRRLKENFEMCFHLTRAL